MDRWPEALEIKGFSGESKRQAILSKLPAFSGGEEGIRTLDTLMGYTRFPIMYTFKKSQIAIIYWYFRDF